MKTASPYRITGFFVVLVGMFTSGTLQAKVGAFTNKGKASSEKRTSPKDESGRVPTKGSRFKRKPDRPPQGNIHGDRDTGLSRPVGPISNNTLRWQLKPTGSLTTPSDRPRTLVYQTAGGAGKVTFRHTISADVMSRFLKVVPENNYVINGPVKKRPARSSQYNNGRRHSFKLKYTGMAGFPTLKSYVLTVTATDESGRSISAVTRVRLDLTITYSGIVNLYQLSPAGRIFTGRGTMKLTMHYWGFAPQTVDNGQYDYTIEMTYNSLREGVNPGQRTMSGTNLSWSGGNGISAELHGLTLHTYYQGSGRTDPHFNVTTLSAGVNYESVFLSMNQRVLQRIQGGRTVAYELEAQLKR